ncbi:MBL fold metallo-hydrolase [Actinomycetaceae bacterium MB13-C1-2]|nr:MBL fold metallo-hydrolase [Actinomycetaceae bacterium MB13-C1-2]
MLEVRSILASLFDSSCYILWDDRQREAVVVDPGPGTASAVGAILEENELSVASVLLTHGHVDHVWDSAQVEKQGSAIPVYYTEPDGFFLEDPVGEIGFEVGAFDLGAWNRPENLVALDELNFSPAKGIFTRVIPAPGHSPGSAIFLIGADGLASPLALSGDVVFAGTVGRTDLPGGDEREMRQSLRTLGNILDPATILLPGHGPQTTWAKEMETNPYVLRACKVG